MFGWVWGVGCGGVFVLDLDFAIVFGVVLVFDFTLGLRPASGLVDELDEPLPLVVDEWVVTILCG